MPTLDQLAPAIAVSDTDEMLVSQNGICVKATRAQVIAGLQEELLLPRGSLMGGNSAGTAGPETISVGANLTLAQLRQFDQCGRMKGAENLTFCK